MSKPLPAHLYNPAQKKADLLLKANGEMLARLQAKIRGKKVSLTETENELVKELVDKTGELTEKGWRFIGNDDTDAEYTQAYKKYNKK